jgi:cytochrome c-type biogenesis protein CcmH
MAFLGEQLPLVAEAAGVAYAPPEARGPSAADVAVAGEKSAEDRAAMIAGMVDGLEARLMAEGGSAGEWAQLLTALGVLNEPARRAAALARAEAAHAGDPQALAAIRAAAGAGP